MHRAVTFAQVWIDFLLGTQLILKPSFLKRVLLPWRMESQQGNLVCLEWHRKTHGVFRFSYLQFQVFGFDRRNKWCCLRAQNALMPDTSASGSELLAPVLGRQCEEFEVSLPVPDERGRCQTAKEQWIGSGSQGKNGSKLLLVLGTMKYCPFWESGSLPTRNSWNGIPLFLVQLLLFPSQVLVSFRRLTHGHWVCCNPGLSIK